MTASSLNLATQKPGPRIRGTAVGPGWIYRVDVTVTNPVVSGQLRPYVVVEYADTESGQINEVWHNAGISVEYPRSGRVFIDVAGYTSGELVWDIRLYELRGGAIFTPSGRQIACDGRLDRMVDDVGQVWVPWSTAAARGGAITAPPGAEWARSNASMSVGTAVFLPDTIIPVLPDMMLIAEGDCIATFWTRI